MTNLPTVTLVEARNLTRKTQREQGTEFAEKRRCTQVLRGQCPRTLG
jgi:hypothetical protein